MNMDGLSITFVRWSGGKLEPKDSYQSEWIGLKDNRGKVRFGDDHTPVIGIIGKHNQKVAPGWGCTSGRKRPTKLRTP